MLEQFEEMPLEKHPWYFSYFSTQLLDMTVHLIQWPECVCLLQATLSYIYCLKLQSRNRYFIVALWFECKRVSLFFFFFQYVALGKSVTALKHVFFVLFVFFPFQLYGLQITHPCSAALFFHLCFGIIMTCFLPWWGRLAWLLLTFIHLADSKWGRIWSKKKKQSI